MTGTLMIGFYLALAALVAILIAGMVNLVRSDEGQASRSNQLMRARVVAQAVVVGILVILGIVLGSIRL
ncbi:MAG: HIG1 domain-containing protein [Pseudomonadota bacterium]